MPNKPPAFKSLSQSLFSGKLMINVMYVEFHSERSGINGKFYRCSCLSLESEAYIYNKGVKRGHQSHGAAHIRELRPLLELSYQPKNFLSLLWQWQGATVVAIQKDKREEIKSGLQEKKGKEKEYHLAVLL